MYLYTSIILEILNYVCLFLWPVPWQNIGPGCGASKKAQAADASATEALADEAEAKNTWDQEDNPFPLVLNPPTP